MYFTTLPLTERNVLKFRVIREIIFVHTLFLLCLAFIARWQIKVVLHACFKKTQTKLLY